MKILLVEDSKLSRKMFKAAVGDEHQYIEATDGLSGLELFLLHRPDLVVLDLTMPDIDGLTVLDKIREVDPEANVVIGTADQQDISRQEALRRGARAYLGKPYTRESLGQLIKSLTEKQHAT